jgi:hypothetical protein
MANVKEILYRTPPPVLYHYTTQQGILGIIRDKEIWASHTQYLNDVREFRHALDVREELPAMIKAQTPAREDVCKCLAEMKEAMFSGMEGINVMRMLVFGARRCVVTMEGVRRSYFGICREVFRGFFAKYE